MFHPRLAPLDRPPELAREERQQQFFLIGLNFDPERTADVRRYDANLAFGKTQHLGDARPERMWIRRRRPHRQAIFISIVVGQISARLYGASRDAMAADFFLDNNVSVLKNLIDAVSGEMIFVNDVAANLLMDTRRVGFHSGFRIHDCRQPFEIHRHDFDGILRQIAVIGNAPPPAARRSNEFYPPPKDRA